MALESFSVESLFDTLIADGISSFEGGGDISIVEFAEEFIFNGKNQLYPPQRAILKAFYGEELSEDEKDTLEYWTELDRTTYVPGRNYRHLVLEAGRRSGKCLALDSLIYTDRGLLRAGDLVDANGPEWQDIDLTVALPRSQRAKAIKGYNNGIDRTRRITTAAGYEINATHKHRIKVLSTNGKVEWKYFRELEVGDIACIERNIDLWPNYEVDITQEIIQAKNTFSKRIRRKGTSNYPSTFNKDWGYVLGLLAGDGTWNSQFCQLTGDRQDLEFYLPILETTFEGAEVDISDFQTRTPRLTFDNSQLKEVFKQLGYSTNSRNGKKVPWVIMRSPKAVVASFLSGLFDTDGSAEKEGKSITFSTASRQLAIEVQLLLLNFGIVSKRKEKLIKGKVYQNLTLVGLKSRRIFAKEIGFRLPRKQKLLLQSLETPVKEGGTLESIPFQHQWVHDIKSSLKTNYGEFLGKTGVGGFKGRAPSGKAYKSELKKIFGNSWKEGCLENLTYNRIANFFEWVQNHPEVGIESHPSFTHFKDIYELDYYYDPITEIKEEETATVDLSVPGPETYTAAGFTSHNTTIISILVLYEFYKLISLENPAAHYGLLPNSPIAIFVISQSQEQVKETLFAQIRGYAEGSDYFKGLTNSGKIEVLTAEIRCPKKNILLAAKHTNSKSLVGYSIKTLVLDEASRFEIDEFGNSKADLIWSNVGKGVQTFGKEGHKIAISSAWEPGDYIEKLYGMSQRDISSLGFRLRTWDVNLNPNMSEEMIKSSEEYIKDPLAAATEFEGIRNAKQGTFMIPDNVRKCFTGRSCLDATQIPLDVTNDLGDVRHYVGVNVSRLEPLIQGVSYAHCDYGVKKDAASFSVVSAKQLEDGRWGIQVDGIMMWKPFLDRDKNNQAIRRIVSFINAEEIMLRVCKARRVTLMTFDSFQSEHAVQTLHQSGIRTDLMSTSNQSQLLYFSVTKNLIDSGLLILPQDSHWSTTIEAEFCNLIQIPSTGRIDHTKSSTKDAADSIVNAVYNCYINMSKVGLVGAQGPGLSTIKSKSRENIANYQTHFPNIGGGVSRLRRAKENRLM